ncbi:MAG: D-alanine--D-alanine ligase [Candidatus Atelocyanobacterium thalassa]
MAKILIGLLFGGSSEEHTVSINSAAAILQALQAGDNSYKYDVIPIYIQKNGIWIAGKIAEQVLETKKPLPTLSLKKEDKFQLWQFPTEVSQIDVWFPVLHGPNGEDGTIQGLLKLMQVPFVGANVLGSAVSMDKIIMKTIFSQMELPQVKYLTFEYSNTKYCSQLSDDIRTNFGYPCFVKPANLGSSVGVSKVYSHNELDIALKNAASYDNRIIIEEGIVARELECGVLGNDIPKVSVIGEITFENDFYDYEAKYKDSSSKIHIPAKLPDHIIEKIQQIAIRAFTGINCKGLARVDFFYVEETQEIFINEINSFPGFTEFSMYPKLWMQTGLSFNELVDELIELALK